MENLLFIGLGRIGLPQSLVFAKKGFTVYGYDHDPVSIDEIKNRNLPFYEPKMNEYLNATLDETFLPISSWEEITTILPKIDAVFFTLGTSVPDSKSCLKDDMLDLSTIEKVLDKVFLKKDTLKTGIKLIFRTTLPLGGVERLKDYIEQTHKVVEGELFHIAFVPERLIEGKAIEEEENLPKIIGTYSEVAFSQIKQIFEKVGGKIVKVSSPKVAEFCKLTDNSYRNLLFSFSNEIAMLAGETNVDVVEVIEAVNQDYDRNNIKQPGFVSGYCLGKDPYIFEYGFQTKFPSRDTHSVWYQGRKTNDFLIDLVSHKVIENITIDNATTVTILGLSFKENVDDFRMSHAIFLMEKLLSLGVKRFRVFDPSIDKNRYTQLPMELENHIEYKSPYMVEELFSNSSAIIIAHRHDEIVMANKRATLLRLLNKAKENCYIYDAWNVWREAVSLSGVKYAALGFGG